MIDYFWMAAISFFGWFFGVYEYAPFFSRIFCSKWFVLTMCVCMHVVFFFPPSVYSPPPEGIQFPQVALMTCVEGFESK